MQCTCGATLPEDARFCHRCGKPQFEEDLARFHEEPVAVEPPPIPQPPPAVQARIDFGNRRAVMVSIVIAMLTLLLFTMCAVTIPFAAGILLLPLFCLAGFGAAYFYIRQTGEKISPQGGARLGFMTALWAFLVVVLLSVLLAVLVSNPGLRGELLSIASANSNPATQELAKLLNDPRKFILLLMGQLLVYFCLFTFPSMLGGMLGVRFQAKK
ncbi:MAG TPA: hypothetical protein VN737_11535 [Bryobacteraceae bacterium]|nr:hypothetical protein [Bryobacteraceae bacterium]